MPTTTASMPTTTGFVLQTVSMPTTTGFTLFFLLLLALVAQVSPLNPSLSTHRPPRIIACASSVELLRGVSAFVKPDSSVLEVGAQLTDVSAAILASGASYFAIDVERKAPLRSNEHNSGYRTACGSSLDYFAEVSSLSSVTSVMEGRGPFSLMLMDFSHMTGMDLPIDAISTISSLLASQPSVTPTVVLKSKQLSKLASRLHHARKLVEGRSKLVDPPPLDTDSPFRTEHEPSIVAAVGVSEYRETIPHVVRETDFVLEIGCHHGTTTRLLDAAGAAAVGVDVGVGVVATARRQAPGLRFEVANAWSPAGLLRMLEGQSVDVIYVDVGGLSGQDGLLESMALLRSLGNTLEPRTIVIKSKCMRDLSRDLTPFWEVWEKIRKNEKGSNPN